MIVHFRVLRELRLDIIDFLFDDISSADGASLVFGHLEDNLASEFILLFHPLHEPISPKADKVEPVETIVHSYQINSVCEFLYLQSTLVFAERL